MRNGRVWTGTALLVLAALAFCPGAGAQPAGLWEPWKSETVSLDQGQSVQVRVTFADLPVRTWRLTVDGGDNRVDCTVLRVRGEALLYARNDESRHTVDVPWGRGEEALVVLTNRSHAGAFVVTLSGPPRDQAPAAYSYWVNRTLEAYAGGRRLDAEDLCRRALDADPADAEAMVLMAGFKRDRGLYDQASDSIDGALALELTGEMREVAQAMRAELLQLRAPMPAPLREGIVQAENDLDQGRGEPALETAEKLLATDLDTSVAAESRLHLIRGRALAVLGRNFEAIDAFTAALQLARTHAEQGVIYLHMGRLYRAMENLQQAQGAYTMALQNGLPAALDMQARDELKAIDRVLGRER